MTLFKKALLLLSLSQLGACAVMSKTECVNADWQQIGFEVATKGAYDKAQAFSTRKKACDKHGTDANWQQFSLGHSDGTVEYCQLNNAVKHGIDGATKAIKNQVCPERDYPGFNHAFNVGYKLHVLNSRVNESHLDISRVESLIENKKQNIYSIDRRLTSKDLEKNQRKHLRYERKQKQQDIKHLIYDLRQYDQRLHHDLYLRDNYADYVYDDYLKQLSNEFIDPRGK